MQLWLRGALTLCVSVSLLTGTTHASFLSSLSSHWSSLSSQRKLLVGASVAIVGTVIWQNYNTNTTTQSAIVTAKMNRATTPGQSYAIGLPHVSLRGKDLDNGASMSNADTPNWRLEFITVKNIKDLRAIVEQNKVLQNTSIDFRPAVVFHAIQISTAQTVANNIKEVLAGGAPVDQEGHEDYTALQQLSIGRIEDSATSAIAIKTLLENGASMSKKREYEDPGTNSLDYAFDHLNHNAIRALSEHTSVKRIVNNNPIDGQLTYLNKALSYKWIPIENKAIIIENFLKAGATINEDSFVMLAQHHKAYFAALRPNYAMRFFPCFCKPVLSRCTPDMLLKVRNTLAQQSIALPCLEDTIKRYTLDILLNTRDTLAEKYPEVIFPCLEAEIQKYHDATRAALAENTLMITPLRNMVYGYLSSDFTPETYLGYRHSPAPHS